MIEKRLNLLRNEMKRKNMDAYIIPTADYHQSEYVGEFFMSRAYLSGFTGSAGTLVVTMNDAGLWTDGRYFIQAANQLENTPITLYRQGEEGVPTIEEYLLSQVENGGIVGFDGRTMEADWGEKLERVLRRKRISLSFSEDLVDHVWSERPALPDEEVFVLREQYAGKSAIEKIADVKAAMKEEGASVLLLASLDDIAWILNIRGNDIPCNPVVLSYLLISEQEVRFYTEQTKLNSKVRAYFEEMNVAISYYNRIYEDVKKIGPEQSVMYDGKRINYALIKGIQDGVTLIDSENPTILMKAIKNPIEVENLKKAHIKDGVAVTKFMHWLKTNINDYIMTEITASEYLEQCRREQKGYIEPSFDTICAYKENAAMMHYSAKEDSCKVLKPEGLLLVDSGGQYYEGTTDVTRTFALGNLTKEEKKHYTLVVKSMLNLANAKFLYGCTGMNLDILARGPIWDMELDYKCGTGHGIGYLLNVHEAPNGFRWKKVPDRNDSCVLEEGMVTTDEPGIYIEGSHGIRIENELVTKKGIKNEYGQYMYFEQITMVPIDLDALDLTYFNELDRLRLNAYHKMVYRTIEPYMNEEQKLWLAYYTREI